MFAEKDMVRIAKRENNKKRKYLVVNSLQAKHMPVSPRRALSLFDSLADMVSRTYRGEKVLLIGFAETATAIGARVAVRMDACYMQTTREEVDGAEYLFFTESHSHATEQKLVKNDLEEHIGRFQRIIFIEDEVTTGNTILNIVRLIEQTYPGEVSFSVASLLNGMDYEALKKYSDRKIGVHYLLKTDHGGYAEQAEFYRGDGAYYTKNIQPMESSIACRCLTGYMNTRRMIQGTEYGKACELLWEQIYGDLDCGNCHDILVIGTEEFMYPAIYAAGRLEECGKQVRCHSTTRSPIVVSAEQEYPLHTRFELVSLYDDDRTTFLYNLRRYDCVLVITDAGNALHKGMDTLIHALQSCGNTNIHLYRWC